MPFVDLLHETPIRVHRALFELRLLEAFFSTMDSIVDGNIYYRSTEIFAHLSVNDRNRAQSGLTFGAQIASSAVIRRKNLKELPRLPGLKMQSGAVVGRRKRGTGSDPLWRHC